MNMSEVLVSVVIPTYGRPRFLARAIRSVLSQEYSNFEIIIVDDNSPDSVDRSETERILVEEFSHFPKLTYVKHPDNLNGAAARNTGISVAKGEFIAFLDDDDEFRPAKLARQVGFLLSNHDYQACYCKSVKYKGGVEYYRTRYNSEGDITSDVVMLLNEGNSSSLLFRSECLREVNGFDTSFKRHQDVELLVRFLQYYKIGCVDDYLLNVHIDGKRNTPSIDEYVMVKKVFIERIVPLIDDLKVRRRALAYHKFDLFIYALRSRAWGVALHNIPNLVMLPGFVWSSRYKFLKVFRRAL